MSGYFYFVVRSASCTERVKQDYFYLDYSFLGSVQLLILISMHPNLSPLGQNWAQTGPEFSPSAPFLHSGIALTISDYFYFVLGWRFRELWLFGQIAGYQTIALLGCIWKLSRNSGGNLQNFFRSHFGLKTSLKSPILDLETDFSIFRPSKCSVFLHNSFFGS